MKNLVISCVGDESLHPNWISDRKLKTFDLFLVYYGDDKNTWKKDSDFYISAKGTKFELLNKVLKDCEDIIQEYDNIWFPDDDILSDTKTINRMFSIFAEYSLELAQPSLCRKSYISRDWLFTKNFPFSVIRFTNIIEGMVPIFSKNALNICKDTFSESVSGWGVEWMWIRLITNGNKTVRKIAILDEVCVTHTRKQSLKSGFYLRLNKDPAGELKEYIKKNNLKMDVAVYEIGLNVLGKIITIPAFPFLFSFLHRRQYYFDKIYYWITYKFTFPSRMRSRILRRRVSKHKTKYLARAHLYLDRPKVSFLIQSFNHKNNIKEIVRRLRKAAQSEIVVCEDGSIDGSLKLWDKYLDMPNDFIIRSNDLHEIRTYDRAIRLARGEFICLLQDDSIPPLTPQWFHQAMALFDKFTNLVILGGFLAFHGLESRNTLSKGLSPGDITSVYTDSSLLKTRVGIPFMFVEAVNIGPVFIRKDFFLSTIGGFDFQYSTVGWPGIHFDIEMSLRTWLKGGQVGFYKPFFEQAGGRGTEIFGHRDKRQSQLKKNYKQLRREYADRMTEINALVKIANKKLKQVI